MAEVQPAAPLPSDKVFQPLSPPPSKPDRGMDTFYLIRVNTTSDRDVHFIKTRKSAEVANILERYADYMEDFSPLQAAEYFCRLGGTTVRHPHQEPNLSHLPLITLQDGMTRDWNDLCGSKHDGVIIRFRLEDNREVYTASQVGSLEAMDALIELFTMDKCLNVKQIVPIIQKFDTLYCYRMREEAKAIVSKAVPLQLQATTITEVSALVKAKIVEIDGSEVYIGNTQYSTLERRKRRHYHTLVDDHFPLVTIQPHTSLPAVYMSRKKTWRAT